MTTIDHQSIQAHANMVYATCLRITGNAQDAADVSQEVFVAWLQQHKEIHTGIGQWLHGTARQRSLDWLRKQHRRTHHELQAAQEQAEIGVSQNDVEWQSPLDVAISELDEDARILIIDHHLLGQSQTLLAKRRKCTQATISRKLSDALQLLQRSLMRRGISASGALLLTWLTATKANACPPTLTAPLYAQAHVFPANDTAITVTRFSVRMKWLVVASIIFVVGALVWQIALRAKHPQLSPAAWEELLSEKLLPLDPAIHPISPKIRYPSIEAAIAQLPHYDENAQTRIRQLVGLKGDLLTSAISPTDAHVMDSIHKITDRQAPLLPHQEKALGKIQRLIDPILAELRDAHERGLTVTISDDGWLARDYNAGIVPDAQARSEDNKETSLADFTAYFTTLRAITLYLIETVVRAEQVNKPLKDLEIWTKAISPTWHPFTSLVGPIRCMAERDQLYLRLCFAKRINHELMRSWITETCPYELMMRHALQQALWVIVLPYLQDIHEGRSEPRWIPVGAKSVSSLAAAMWLPQHHAALTALLNGPLQNKPDATETWYSSLADEVGGTQFAGILATLARQQSEHRARRAAALVLITAENTGTIPTDKQIIYAGNATEWSLVYRNLSPHRFRIEIDFGAGYPALNSLSDFPAQYEREKSRAAKTSFFDFKKTLLEIEVNTETLPSSLQPFDDYPIPMPPIANQ